MAKMVLNAKSIQALKPGADRVDYFDGGRGAVPGFHVRVSPSGEKTFSVLYRIYLGGKSTLRRLTIGSTDETTLEAARERASEARRDAGKGIDPAQQKVIERTAETFEDLADTYLKKHASKKRSAYEDQRIIEKYLKPKLKYTRAKDVTRAQVRAILEDIAENGLDGEPAPVMANRVLSCVRKIFNFGISRDLVESNPCALIEPPGGAEESRERVLNEQEIKTVWATWDTVAAKDAMTSNIVDTFRLRLLTAQRSEEVVAMRWDEIDLESRIWTIPAERSKNQLPHRVWLSDPVIRILKHAKREKPSAWVFPGRRAGQPIKETKGVQAEVREVAALEEHWTPHDLRRTATTMLAELGVMPFVISRVLNHANADHGPEAQSAITAIYNRHSYDAQKKDALDKLAKKVMAIVKDLRAAHA